MLTKRITVIFLLVVFAAGCQHERTSQMDCRLDVRITGIESPEEIEGIIRASLLEKYSLTNINEGYSIYYVTNRETRWLFIQAANAPRGLGVFNLYCYERKKPDYWLLKGYVPVFESFYTNSSDWKLSFQFDNQSLNAIFRGEVIFSTRSVINAPNQ